MGYDYNPNDITDYTAMWLVNDAEMLAGAQAIAKRDPSGHGLIRWLDHMLYGPGRVMARTRDARHELQVYANSKARDDLLQDIDGRALVAAVLEVEFDAATYAEKAKQLGIWPADHFLA